MTETMVAMKISVQDGKSCEKILKVEVSEDQIQKEYDLYYKAISSTAKIPGFRPGKAPRNVLAMHYGKDAKGRVLQNLISESYRQAVKEKSLIPLGMPDIQKVDFKDQWLHYEAKIEVRPKIKLSRVTGLNAKKEKLEIKPEEFEEALTRVRESLAQFKVVEDRPAQLGDYLIADYTCQVEGKEIDKRTDDWFEIREDEFLKGFSIQLVGVKPGDERQVKLMLPENFGLKEAAKKEAVFQVKVKEIKRKVLPELDDNMAKEAGDFKSLDALKEKIRQDIEESKQRELEAKYETALLEELIKQNKVELPEGLVARRLDHLVKQSFEYQQRMNPKVKLEEVQDKLKGDLTPEARRQVHLAFLLDEIVTREGITVLDADLKERYQRVAAQVRQSSETVEKYYESHEEAKHSLMDQVRNEKAIEFVKKNAKK